MDPVVAPGADQTAPEPAVQLAMDPLVAVAPTQSAASSPAPFHWIRWSAPEVVHGHRVSGVYLSGNASEGPPGTIVVDLPASRIGVPTSVGPAARYGDLDPVERNGYLSWIAQSCSGPWSAHRSSMFYPLLLSAWEWRAVVDRADYCNICDALRDLAATLGAQPAQVRRHILHLLGGTLLLAPQRLLVGWAYDIYQRHATPGERPPGILLDAVLCHLQNQTLPAT